LSDGVVIWEIPDGGDREILSQVHAALRLARALCVLLHSNSTRAGHDAFRDPVVAAGQRSPNNGLQQTPPSRSLGRRS